VIAEASAEDDDLPAATFQGHRVVMASRDLTGDLLTADDSFFRQMSALDRRILALSAAPVDKQAVIQHLRDTAQDWTPGEVNALRSSLAEAEQAANAAGIEFGLPQTVYLAKSPADLYSGSPHTRCATVFMPEPQPASILLHELYHVMSRLHPEIRAGLYALVGFDACHVDLRDLGPDVRDVVITNPDTEAFGEACITLQGPGGPTRYTPLNIGQGAYDGTFDGWLHVFEPILVEVRDEKPVVAGGKTSSRPLGPDYLDAVGGNGSREPFHPEELIALNLTQAVLPLPGTAPDFPNEQLVAQVKERLADL
jgi:hypothetical protein